MLRRDSRSAEASSIDFGMSELRSDGDEFSDGNAPFRFSMSWVSIDNCVSYSPGMNGDRKIQVLS